MATYLRELQDKDAPYMLEWMQDSSIACFFRFGAEIMTIDSCRDYIMNAGKNERCKHYAIVDEVDEYLGTISLKEIDYEKKEAEYAISTRKKVHGTGAALEATHQIWKIAFEDLQLERIYLNVLTENKRANAFYIKAGFQFEYLEKDALEIRGEKKSLNWYAVNRVEYMEKKNV